MRAGRAARRARPRDQPVERAVGPLGDPPDRLLTTAGGTEVDPRSSASRRSTPITRWPCSASRAAVAAPMPDAAPVTRQTDSSSRPRRSFQGTSRSLLGSRGRPSERSPMLFFCTSSVPPPIRTLILVQEVVLPARTGRARRRRTAWLPRPRMRITRSPVRAACCGERELHAPTPPRPVGAPGSSRCGAAAPCSGAARERMYACDELLAEPRVVGDAALAGERDDVVGVPRRRRPRRSPPARCRAWCA